MYHRLNVIRLRLPALRERREDVPVLARYFLQRSAQQLGVEAKRMADAALERLGQFQFPGNVRQLENICHWLTVMAPTQTIEVKDLPPEVLAPSGSATAAPAAFTALSSGVGAGLAETVQVQTEPNELSGHDAPFPAQNLASPFDATVANAAALGWEPGLEQEALALLKAGRTDVWDALTRRFETSLIQAALATTRGRRIEAAQKLGIGRNTITRKIQELGLDEA
jgi:two-component system nitrogen regulation response regulator GlnG